MNYGKIIIASTIFLTSNFSISMEQKRLEDEVANLKIQVKFLMEEHKKHLERQQERAKAVREAFKKEIERTNKEEYRAFLEELNKISEGEEN